MVEYGVAYLCCFCISGLLCLPVQVVRIAVGWGTRLVVHPRQALRPDHSSERPMLLMYPPTNLFIAHLSSIRILARLLVHQLTPDPILLQLPIIEVELLVLTFTLINERHPFNYLLRFHTLIYCLVSQNQRSVCLCVNYLLLFYFANSNRYLKRVTNWN